MYSEPCFEHFSFFPVEQELQTSSFGLKSSAWTGAPQAIVFSSKKKKKNEKGTKTKFFSLKYLFLLQNMEFCTWNTCNNNIFPMHKQLVCHNMENLDQEAIIFYIFLLDKTHIIVNFKWKEYYFFCSFSCSHCITSFQCFSTNFNEKIFMLKK